MKTQTEGHFMVKRSIQTSVALIHMVCDNRIICLLFLYLQTMAQESVMIDVHQRRIDPHCQNIYAAQDTEGLVMDPENSR